MRMVLCDDIEKVVNHNTETLVRMIQRVNKEIGRLKKKNHSYVMAGLVLGIASEFCFMVQNQRIRELEEKLSNLNGEIEELRDRKGD